ncbi:YopX family protein [Streptococcus gallolyticus]|uniref:YopX family protein n=1 Tax=Streptococcus gallolyticus TaxID=315405 RepID=UPI00115E9291|nr:YopX family protein [Streptococcus gallolyticus]
MGEIKFRAWWEKGKRMLDIATIDFLEKEVKSHANVMYSFDEIELMQSTGLVDENGKEVFEGDVLLTYDAELAKVYWDDVLAGWFVDFIYETAELSEVAGLQSSRSICAIVGNVYENPELMEEE